MALRSLLRRIANPVLLPPSGPRMGPVHGVSPAAVARFMKTGCQGEAKTVAEQESIRVWNQHFKDAHNKYGKDFAQCEEAARQRVAEFSGAVDDFRKVVTTSVFFAVAIPWIMIIGRKIGRKCQAYHPSWKS